MCRPASKGTIMTTDKLDPREEHFRISSHHPERQLFLRYLPPHSRTHRVVLYVHGGTFPSALSIAHRFDGRSWRDELCAAGFQVWGLDFQALAGFQTLTQRWRSPPPACRRSAAPRMRVASSNKLFDSSAIVTGSDRFRLSPIPGEPSWPAASPG